MQLPTLYKKTATGAIQQWDIGTEGNVIVTQWGQVGGAVQEARDPVLKGKNTGKKNSTTPEQQAQAEAKSQWEKKLKKGYVTSSDGAEKGEVDAIIEGGISPMLAHRFDQHGHKLKYPCYVQPKLDGHRCIAVVDGNGKCTLWTRTRKPITSMQHIVADIEALEIVDVVFDGELYNHEYRTRFEELTSFIRDSEARPGSEVVQYHIYDLAHTDIEFEFRLGDLGEIGEHVRDDSLLKFVETYEAEDEVDLMRAFDTFVFLGYEGTIARNAHGLYVNKRSYDLLKIKEFLDGEFLVTRVEEGRGKLAGHAIFVCTTGSQEFKAKMVGPLEELKKYWEDPKLAVGRLLTVKYQGLTGKNGVPRFPVAVRFKEDM